MKKKNSFKPLKHGFILLLGVACFLLNFNDANGQVKNKLNISPADIQSISVKRQGDTLLTTIFLKNGKTLTLNNRQTTSFRMQAQKAIWTKQLRKKLAYQRKYHIYTFVEQMPRFPGGEKALMKFLHDHIHYPKVARENGIQGTVVVQFVVDTTGALTDITTAGAKKGGGLEEEAIRVVKIMPHWIPGMQSGKKVKVQYSLPVRFVLGGPENKGQKMPPPPPPPAPAPKNKTNNPASHKVFTFVEQMPHFPGGHDALMKYLSENVHYPKVARENGIQGTVTVQFIVTPTGALTHITTVGTKKGGGLEEEAMRLVKAMPHWIPGEQSGKKVSVQYSLPVHFVLQ